jgi:hypothetical protein
MGTASSEMVFDVNIDVERDLVGLIR